MRRRGLARVVLAVAAIVATSGRERGEPGAALPIVAAGEPAGPALRAGDRVVFYGDSITEQRLYTRYVQQYVYVRHPEWDVRCFNAGWGGDTATGALERLERDVLVLRPTVVTLFFGMNDGGYRAADAAVTAKYRASMAGIVKALEAKGVRVVVFTPGCVDPDKNPALGTAGYLETLEGLGRTALEVAREAGARGVDVFHPMLAFQQERKRLDPAFTMIPDAVHPSPAGHLVVAKTMLEGLGLEPLPPLGSFDLASGKGKGLVAGRASDAEVVLATAAPATVPYYVDPASADVAARCGLLDALAGQRLTVAGLPAGDWELTIDGGLAGRFSSADLAKGVAVAGTWSSAAKDVHDLVMRRENAYFQAWREVRLPLAGRPGLDQVLDGLMAADEGFHAMIRARTAPERPATLTFTRAPGTDNLALKKPYVASDPNTFGWGTGGLTDGSWDADAAHCFATGAAAEFPKSVTVDLEKPVRVAAVRLGVPDFGATHTVAVSVSADGKRFRDVGRVEFSTHKAERKTVAFEARSARYVRLTYLDHHAEQVGYPPTFAFTTELEVYGPPK